MGTFHQHGIQSPLSLLHLLCLLPFPSCTYLWRLSTTHQCSADYAQRTTDRGGSKRELEAVTVKGKYDGGITAGTWLKRERRRLVLIEHTFFPKEQWNQKYFCRCLQTCTKVRTFPRTFPASPFVKSPKHIRVSLFFLSQEEEYKYLGEGADKDVNMETQQSRAFWDQGRCWRQCAVH